MAVATPKGVTLKHKADGLRAGYRRFTTRSLLYLACGVIPLSVMVVLLSTRLAAGETLAMVLGLEIAGILVLLAAYVYWQLTDVINTTVIRLTADHLTVRHTPQPWFGGRTLDLEAVKQIQVERRAHRSKAIRKPTVTYRVYARLRDQSKVPLVEGLARQEQASCLKRAVANHLRDLHQP